MITAKLFGVVKKSFDTDKIIINENNITIQQLFDFLLTKKPKNAPDLEIDNLLVAVNGIESSAINGKLTKLKTGDVVSIIPIIHGGSYRSLQFKTHSSFIELFSIKIKDNSVEFLDKLRMKFPKLVIQGISPNYILNKTHAKKIITVSLSAKNNDTLLSKKLETDILLRFAVTTQISQALKKVGIKNSLTFFIFAIGRKSSINELYRELKPFLYSESFSKDNYDFLKKKFNISNKQIDAIFSKTPLEDLLTEKAAILV